MFQTFAKAAEFARDDARLPALRGRLKALKLDGFLIPHEDEYMGEYLPAAAERLAWLTGFTGSAGQAVVGLRRAALFVDGRYTLQARNQADPEAFEILEVPDAKPTEWITGTFDKGDVIGFDPWLHTVLGIETLTAALARHGIKLKPVARNPIDGLWGKTRPTWPVAPIKVQPESLTGRAASDKIKDVQGILKSDGQAALVMTRTDSIAWLFNIRGSDIPHTPIVLARAIVPQKGKPTLFVAAAKLNPKAQSHLKAIARIAEPAAFLAELKALKEGGERVRLETAAAGFAIARALGGPKHYESGPDPCQRLKAVKTPVEIEGAKAAHVRDGIALCRFLSWLDREIAAGRPVDEIGAVKKLEACRSETGELAEISFDTISGSGPNGAIVHYRVSEETNRRLKPGELFLVDSGGQYPDGTTDVTRTVAIGAPSREMRERFTQVLKAHIALSTLRFPKGTRGVEIDAIVRAKLWAHGLDFNHGTGHGIGSYLSVHEGPQSISRGGMVALEPGMICSNEPGYYKEGAFGIRIENLELVTPLASIPGGERAMMGFESLTRAPFDRRLIEVKLLTEAERGWIDRYHASVFEAIGSRLDGPDHTWLTAATRPL